MFETKKAIRISVEKQKSYSPKKIILKMPDHGDFANVTIFWHVIYK